MSMCRTKERRAQQRRRPTGQPKDGREEFAGVTILGRLGSEPRPACTDGDRWPRRRPSSLKGSRESWRAGDADPGGHVSASAFSAHGAVRHDGWAPGGPDRMWAFA
jgi:hypothetical protein